MSPTPQNGQKSNAKKLVSENSAHATMPTPAFSLAVNTRSRCGHFERRWMTKPTRVRAKPKRTPASTLSVVRRSLRPASSGMNHCSLVRSVSSAPSKRPVALRILEVPNPSLKQRRHTGICRPEHVSEPYRQSCVEHIANCSLVFVLKLYVPSCSHGVSFRVCGRRSGEENDCEKVL